MGEEGLSRRSLVNPPAPSSSRVSQLVDFIPLVHYTRFTSSLLWGGFVCERIRLEQAKPRLSTSLVFGLRQFWSIVHLLWLVGWSSAHALLACVASSSCVRRASLPEPDSCHHLLGTRRWSRKRRGSR